MNPVTRLRSALTSAVTKRGGWQEFLSKPRLTPGELRAGDLLIVKLYEDYNYWADVDAMAPYSDDIGSDGNSIVLAQAIFSHVRHGSATSEHVVLVAEDGKEACYESVGAGVISSPRLTDRWHAVYRVVQARRRLAQEAVNVARSLARGYSTATHTLQDDAPGGNPPGPTTASVGYRAKAGMAASVFRSKVSGPFRNARLQRVYDAVYNDKQEYRNGLRMICSEFAATCYEVAAMRLGEPPIFQVDPRAMTAKALEATLFRAASYFPFVGIFQGSAAIVHRCPGCSGKVRCMYLIDQQGRRCSMTGPDGKQRFPYLTICPTCNVCNACGEVWAATFNPDDPTTPVFFCRRCDDFPQPGGLHNTIGDIVGKGHVAVGGRREKPLKSDDQHFLR